MTANSEHPVHDPAPASAVERAIAFGVDITLLVKNLRLTPTERIQQAQQVLDSVTALKAEVRAWRKRQAQSS